MFDLRHGDCLEVLRGMADNSVDAIVTDPPYGLSFMGKRWDYDVPSEDIWRECLRVLKPGGHLLAFAGTRTQHRMAVRIEDAGFEIRDMIAWLYGSGFPKSHDVSKAIDKAAGAERKVVGQRTSPYTPTGRNESPDYGTYNQPINEKGYLEYPITAPATPEARQWHGWGTALKPALEPITVARKPLIGTVAENVLTWGTGGMNVDGCRVASNGEHMVNGTVTKRTTVTGDDRKGKALGMYGAGASFTPTNSTLGRWPANLIHDGSEEVVGLFPETTQASWRKPQPDRAYPDAIFPQAHTARERDERGHPDTGSAARFFYCAKASKRDRDEGCEGMEEKSVHRMGHGNNEPDGMTQSFITKSRNAHPTVKPTDLMRYLCRLVTPPGGTVLDPFMGSGSTGKAAVLEGFNFIGIEREAEYIDIARARIEHVTKEPNLWQS